MIKIVRYFAVAAMVTLLLGGSTALAKGRGKARGPEERPSGWERGEKTGWKGDLPPGLEKKAGEEDGVKEKRKKEKKRKIKKKKDGVEVEAGEEVDAKGDREHLKKRGEEEKEGEVKEEVEGLEKNEQGAENLKKESADGNGKAAGKRRGLRERFKSFFGGGE